MADETKNLEIKITTPADLTGAKELNAELPKTTKALGDQKQATKDLKKDTEDATEQMRLFHSEGEEFRRVASELTRISPELGEAFRLIRSPIAGTVAAGIGLFVELKAQIDETNKKLEEMGKTAAEPAFINGIAARLQVFGDAAAAAQSYADKLVEIQASEGGLTEKLAAEVKLDEAVERARAALVSAQKGLAIAQIQQQEASGKLTPVQASEAKAKLEQDALDAKAKADQDAQDRKLAEDAQRLAAAKAAADALAAQNAQAHAQVTGEQAHDKQIAADFGDQSKLIAKAEEIQKQKDEATEELDKLNAFWHGFRGFDGSSLRAEFEALERSIAQADTELRDINAGRNLFRDTQSPKHKAAVQADVDAAAQAEKRLTENTESIAKLTAEIQSLQAIMAATRPLAQQTTEVQGQTIATQATLTEQGDVKRDVNEITRYAGMGLPTPEESRAALEAVKDLSAFMAAHKELVAWLGTIGPDLKTLKADMAKVQSDVAKLHTNTNLP